MEKIGVEHILPPLPEPAIGEMETRLNIRLPGSYKRFLKCTRGFIALDGAVQMQSEHPFIQDGKLFFAEFFLEGDGDQVFFDMQRPDANGEFPVCYYDHENPGNTRKLADSFGQWLEEFSYYEAFNEE